jgi:hypothetical protein
MKSIAKKEFTADLVLEHTCTPVLDELGKHLCTIELFQFSKSVFSVEWDIPDLDETLNMEYG